MRMLVMQAIQKGSIDSCREAHEDWLAKVQATLAAPAQVLAPPLRHNPGLQLAASLAHTQHKQNMPSMTEMVQLWHT